MSLAFSRLPGSGLPIFRAPLDGGQFLYYAPGLLAGVEREQAPALEKALTGQADQPAQLIGISQRLRSAATTARSAWNEMLPAAFKPLCLTLYPHNECNLACAYCYAESGRARASGMLSLQAVRTAAILVAENCRQAKQAFTVVFHGGGEPSLNMDWLDRALAIVENAAAKAQVPIFRYIASNGIMPADQAAWLAEHFDRIGLSCDGPPEIQNAQRPLPLHAPSTPFVEQTARIVRSSGKPLNVRVTITPATVHRQVEIAGYVCEQLRPQEIHVEPVYRGGRQSAASAASAFRPDQAEGFVQEFMQARRQARSYGVTLTTSGSRVGELHGPYCHIFRSVLLLVPGDEVSACFKLSQAARVRQAGLSLGAYEQAELTCDAQAAEALRRKLKQQHANCAGCFNQYHCTGLCPDTCLLGAQSTSDGFRCRLQKALAGALLEETAAQMDPAQTAWCTPVRFDAAADMAQSGGRAAVDKR